MRLQATLITCLYQIVGRFKYFHFFYRRPLIGKRANVCFIYMYWFTFQEECLPLFCSNNHMMINGRCIPVITNIITKAVGLVVEKAVEENSMFIHSRDFNTSTKNAIKLQSRCLDFKWTYVGLSALNDLDLKVTHTLRILLMTTYSRAKNITITQMLSRISICTTSTWTIHLNGQGLSAIFTFPSIQPYDRKDPREKALSHSSVRPSIRENVPYFISKRDFCQQVGLFKI